MIRAMQDRAKALIAIAAPQEVASIGRSLGNKICPILKQQKVKVENLDLLEKIGTLVSTECLTHDLGNPLFGHSDKEAISYFLVKGKDYISKKLLSDEE